MFTFALSTLLLSGGIGPRAAAADPAPPAPAPNKGDSCAKFAVRANAEVQTDPASVTLRWTAEPTAFSHTIYRRFMDETEWPPTPIATLDGAADEYTDNQVRPGILYEYRIDRIGKGYVGRGYLCSGIEIPVTDNRGGLLLLVAARVAAPLSNELARLELDLEGDGWQVVRKDVADEASVTDVKELIRTETQRTPAAIRSLFLFGPLPVPYSGNISPDGHINHRGAWPADLYYGEFGEVWTDVETLPVADPKHPPSPEQRNVAGDGKFDQSAIAPNSIALEIGRVDLSRMTRFDLDEIGLLRRYLDKDHRFRHARVPAEPRGLIDDHFGSFNGEAFAGSAWANFAAFFGADHSETNDWFSTLRTQSCLWAYGCGGGSIERANGVGSTADFAAAPIHAVFTLLFGSYFGDWDRPNSFLRAPLAADGDALTCAWDGRPHMVWHAMTMGRTIGECIRRTQNNAAGRDYLPYNNAKSSRSGRDEDREWEENSVHVALMGDPTLRLHPVPTPRSVEASAASNGMLRLRWDTPPKGGGILVYKKEAGNGPFTRITPTPVTGTECALAGTQPDDLYLLKTAIPQPSACGTYWNTSQAVFVRPPAAGSFYALPHLDGAECVTPEDTPLTIPVETTVLPIRMPRHGTLRTDADGRWIYSPERDFHGADDFALQPRDEYNDGEPAEFRIRIEPVADAPRPISRHLVFTDLRPRSIRLDAENPDAPETTPHYEILAPPTHGRLTGTAPDLVYEPDPERVGADSFSFTATHDGQRGEPGTIRLDPPYFCDRAGRPITPDGRLDDWTSLPIPCDCPDAFGSMGRAAWGGTKDCRFSIRTAYDETNLYVAVAVTDDQVEAIPDRDPWDQDGIEIRLDARPGEQRAVNNGTGEMKDFLLVALSPSEKAEDVWLYQTETKLPDGVRTACVRGKTGYTAEVAIPLSYLDRMAGGNWTGFRLNVAVNDRDGGKLVQLWWKPDWRQTESIPASGSFLKP